MMVSENYQKKIRFAIENRQVLTITSHSMTNDEQVNITQVVNVFLDEIGYPGYSNQIDYVVRELITNAVKANYKRSYFSREGLDIQNEEDYRKGVEGFKKSFDRHAVNQLLEKNPHLYVKVSFSVTLQYFRVMIRNNSPITDEEARRIQNRIEEAAHFTGFKEALAELIDDTEGAGLGLISVLLILKDIGLNADSFRIFSRGGETIGQLEFPVSSLHLKQQQLVREKLIGEIDTLPPLPALINRLLALINDEIASTGDISEEIRTDPALTANLLRTANSAAFGFSRTVVSVEEAVKIIGMKQLEKFILTFGVIGRLKEFGGEQQMLWDHSYRVACYAGLIARSWGLATQSVQIVYTAGLLHDIGQILLFKDMSDGYRPHLIDFCVERGIPQNQLEEILSGMSHETIGAGLCRHWQLPHVLEEIIRCHHHPEGGDPNYKKLINTVYLANAVDNFNNGLIGFNELRKSVLAKIDINSEADLVRFSEGLIDKLLN